MKMWMRGPLFEADVAGMQDMVREIRSEHGRCFLVADVGALTSIDAGARRMMGQWGRLSPDDHASAVAVHGASFSARTLITLTINAVRLMGYREIDLKFMRDEAEALRWIGEQRTALAAAG